MGFIAVRGVTGRRYDINAGSRMIPPPPPCRPPPQASVRITPPPDHPHPPSMSFSSAWWVAVSNKGR